MDTLEKPRVVACDRRSACDRCRGQKLRCVRASTAAHGLDTKCERCRKAGAECVNTLARPRKSSTSEGASERLPPSPSFSSSCSHQIDTALHALSSTSADTQPQTIVEATEQNGPRPRNGYRHCDCSSNTSQGLQSFAKSPKISKITGLGYDCYTEDDSILPMDYMAGRLSAADDCEPSDYDISMLLDMNTSSAVQGDQSEFALDSFQDLRQSPVAMVETRLRETLVTKDKGIGLEDILPRLSSLTSDLINDFSSIKDSRLSDMLIYDDQAPDTNTKNILGALMDRSMIFLSVIEQLKRQEAPNAPSKAPLACSYLEPSDDVEP
ncbi:hypothetical protein BDV19DRAFT_388789 [Aspergillus venezuelensis]